MLLSKKKSYNPFFFYLNFIDREEFVSLYCSAETKFYCFNLIKQTFSFLAKQNVVFETLKSCYIFVPYLLNHACKIYQLSLNKLNAFFIVYSNNKKIEFNCIFLLNVELNIEVFSINNLSLFLNTLSPLFFSFCIKMHNLFND